MEFHKQPAIRYPQKAKKSPDTITIKATEQIKKHPLSNLLSPDLASFYLSLNKNTESKTVNNKSP